MFVADKAYASEDNHRCEREIKGCGIALQDMIMYLTGKLLDNPEKW